MAKRPQNAGVCPACDKPIVWLKHGEDLMPCEGQRRLIIFDYKSDENGLPLDEEKPLVLFEERTGKLVIGRMAWPPEKKRFVSNKHPGKAFTIGHEGHLRNCEQLSKWMSGDAVLPDSGTLATDGG